MKNSKRKAVSGIVCSLLMFTSAAPVLASWSGIVSVSLPPWGGTVNNYSIAVTKTTSSSSFSVYGVRETNALDPHAKIITSEGQSRSDWAAIRQGEYTSGFSSAAVNFYCYSRAGSNAIEPNQTIVQYQYNPY